MSGTVHSRVDIGDWENLEGEGLSRQWYALFLLGISLSRGDAPTESRFIKSGNKHGGGRIWIYEPQPRLPTTTSVIFENNLRDVASKLGKMNQGQIGARLRSEIAQQLSKQTPETIVEVIQSILGGIGAYHIRYGNGELTPDQSLEMLMEHFALNEAVMTQFRLQFPRDEYLIDQCYHERDATHPQDAFYCPAPNCGAFLSQDRQSVPFQCPECDYEIYHYAF